MSVVHQDVGQRELGLDGVEGGGDRLRLADVRLHREAPRAGRLDGGHAGGHVLGLAAQHRDRRAEARELDGDGLAEARPAAGHENGPSLVAPLRQRVRPQLRRLRKTHGVSSPLRIG